MRKLAFILVLTLTAASLALACSGTCPTHGRELRDTGETRVDGKDGKIYHRMYCPADNEIFWVKCSG